MYINLFCIDNILHHSILGKILNYQPIEKYEIQLKINIKNVMAYNLLRTT